MPPPGPRSTRWPPPSRRRRKPLHVVSLAHTGLAFAEMFDLDALSEDSRADGIYEFMFTASPLPITGASGAPVSALAIK